jgi:hypothetical protein
MTATCALDKTWVSGEEEEEEEEKQQQQERQNHHHVRQVGVEEK